MSKSEKAPELHVRIVEIIAEGCRPLFQAVNEQGRMVHEHECYELLMAVLWQDAKDGGRILRVEAFA